MNCSVIILNYTGTISSRIQNIPKKLINIYHYTWLKYWILKYLKKSLCNSKQKVCTGPLELTAHLHNYLHYQYEITKVFLCLLNGRTPPTFSYSVHISTFVKFFLLIIPSHSATFASCCCSFKRVILWLHTTWCVFHCFTIRYRDHFEPLGHDCF